MLRRHTLFVPSSASGCPVTPTFAHSSDNISDYTSFTQAATDNLIIPKFFDKETHRFFRLRLTRGGRFVPSIGELQSGTAVQFPEGLEVGFDQNVETINVRANESQTGNCLGTRSSFVQRSATVRVPLLENSFVTGTTLGDFKHWWDGDGTDMKAFLWWWNPDDTFRTDAFFAVFSPSSSINRRLVTQGSVGRRDIELGILGLKE